MFGKRMFVVAALVTASLLVPTVIASAAPVAEPSVALAVAAPGASMSPDGQVGILSVSRCDGQVCIEINGSGNSVNFINAKVRNINSTSITTATRLYKAGSVIHDYGTHTLSPGQFSTFVWNVNNPNFPSGTYCVQSTGVAGYACGDVG